MNFIDRAISVLITFVSDAAASFWHNINVSQYSMVQIIADVLLVAVLFYWFIMIIRGTRATHIVLGVGVVALVFAVSRWLNLIALGWLLEKLLTVILVALPIIFQQELRRGLEKLGHTKFFLAKEAKEIDFIKSALIETLFDLARRHIGVLVVFRGEVSLKEYLDTGVALNARPSKELLCAIFTQGSPLHDGAVIIDQNKLVAAGCVLPHSFKDYGHAFGTRHKSALALSEATDAKVFIVSEESGNVSYAQDGTLERNISEARAEQLLQPIIKRINNVKESSH